MSEQLAFQGNNHLDEIDLYAVLHISDLRLFVPQTEVKGLESIDVLKAGNDGMCFEYTLSETERYPVYVMDEKLKPQQQLVRAGQECVLLNDGLNQFAVVCEQLHEAMREQIQLRSIPRSMRTARSPIQALAVFEGRLGCVTNAGLLYQYLTHFSLAKVS